MSEAIENKVVAKEVNKSRIPFFEEGRDLGFKETTLDTIYETWKGFNHPVAYMSSFLEDMCSLHELDETFIPWFKTLPMDKHSGQVAEAACAIYAWRKGLLKAFEEELNTYNRSKDRVIGMAYIRMAEEVSFISPREFEDGRLALTALSYMSQVIEPKGSIMKIHRSLVKCGLQPYVDTLGYEQMLLSVNGLITLLSTFTRFPPYTYKYYKKLKVGRERICDSIREIFRNYMEERELAEQEKKLAEEAEARRISSAVDYYDEYLKSEYPTFLDFDNSNCQYGRTKCREIKRIAERYLPDFEKRISQKHQRTKQIKKNKLKTYEKALKAILNGVSQDSIYDFCVDYKICDIEEFMKYASSKCDVYCYARVVDYFRCHKYAIKPLSRVLATRERYFHNDYELTQEDKTKIFKFIDDNNLPCINGVYYELVRKLVRGEFDYV